MKVSLSTPLALAGLLLPFSATAGVTLTLERAQGTDKITATVSLEGDKMRVEDAGKRGTMIMLFDGAAKKMTMLRPDKKTYAVLGEEDLKKMRAQMDQIRAQMKERLKTMPPEQRKKMEEMLAQQGAALSNEEKELKFEPLGQKKTVNGFPCEMYRVLEEGKLKEENCIAPWSDKVLTRGDLQGLEKMRQFFANSIGGGQRGGIWQISKYPGFPVTRSKTGPDGAREVEELKKVEKKKIAAERFTVPAGYKQESPQEIGSGGGPAGK